MPWLLAANPMSSSTIARVSGQKRSTQRGSMPPWLWPMIEIFRPAVAYMVRIALTTYSPASWTSSRPFPGSATVHQGMPRSSSAGSQFQPKLCGGLLPVPWTSRTGVLVVLARLSVHCMEELSWACGTLSAGPG